MTERFARNFPIRFRESLENIVIDTVPQTLFSIFLPGRMNFFTCILPKDVSNGTLLAAYRLMCLHLGILSVHTYTKF